MSSDPTYTPEAQPAEKGSMAPAPSTSRGDSLRAQAAAMGYEEAAELYRPADSASMGTMSAPEHLPGHSQHEQTNTCATASLVTAVMVWAQTDPKAMVDLLDTLMLETERSTIERVVEHRELFLADLDRLRTIALSPQPVWTEPDYQRIAEFWWMLSGGAAGGGLSHTMLGKSLDITGLESDVSAARGGILDVLTSGTMADLQPGQAARLTSELHAVTVGRFADGRWYFNDQGYRPPAEFVADTLAGLIDALNAAADAGTYEMAGETTNVTLEVLSGPEGMADKLEQVLPVGTALGEVDAGLTTLGQTLTAMRHDSRHHDRSAALAAANALAPGAGAVIVEAPVGAYAVYETNTISTANREAATLDPKGGGWLYRNDATSVTLVLSDGAATSVVDVR